MQGLQGEAEMHQPKLWARAALREALARESSVQANKNLILKIMIDYFFVYDARFYLQTLRETSLKISCPIDVYIYLYRLKKNRLKKQQQSLTAETKVN